MTRRTFGRPTHRRLAAPVIGVVAALTLAACGSDDPSATDGASTPVASSDWDAVLAEADGQSVNWYMYGGDDVLNTFVDDVVTPRLAELGVTLNQVRIDDTAEAVNKVLGEKQAGRSTGGAVDAIWINGENFATGVQAELWRCGWSQDLPNAQYVDLEAPEVATDFGVPVDGCEAAWQQANSALVYDSAVLDEADVASVDSLFAWAESDPGRFTYPAPPDFFGSMAVRTVLYDTIGGPASLLEGEVDPASETFTAATTATYDRLNAVEPSLWRGGSTYPQSQDDVEKLYSDGEISAFFTYGPGAVGTKVTDGLYPDTTREAVLDIGNISNVSFVTIPVNAAHQAGALVLANVLQEPEVQLALFEANGVYPAIDLDAIPADLAESFAAVETSPSVLPLDALLADAQPELASDYLAAIEDGWVAGVQQK